MNLKKSISLGTLVCSTLLAAAQNAKIDGYIKGIGNSEFQIGYLNGEERIADTVKTVNDKFSWHGNVSETKKIYLIFPERFVEFYIEPTAMKIEGRADSLWALQMSGSTTQAEADAYKRSLQDLDEKTTQLFSRWDKGTKEEQLALELDYKNLREERASRTKTYIAMHPANIYSAFLISDQSTMGTYEHISTLYNMLDPSIQATSVGKDIQQRLTVLKRSRIGEPMLAFTQNDVDGKPVQFADFKGKYVLVDFWASWCGPCRAENPNVLAAYNTYKDQNFTVLGISLDEDGEKWKKAIQEDDMPWTQVSSLNGFKNEVAAYYGIMGIPSTLLVGPNGDIIAKDLRGEILQQKLSELFKSN